MAPPCDKTSISLATITKQLETVITKLSDGSVTVNTGLESLSTQLANLTIPLTNFNPMEHNVRARALNHKADSAFSMLMPLYDASGCPVPGFPATIGYLAHLMGTPQLGTICRAFQLPETDLMALVTFVGARPFPVLWALKNYVTPEDRSKSVAQRRFLHRNLFRVDGWATVPDDHEEDNNQIREANNSSINPEDNLDSLFDVWGNMPEWFPETLQELADIGAESEFTCLLEFYGQSVEREGCRKRLIEYVGVDVAVVDRVVVSVGCELRWVHG